VCRVHSGGFHTVDLSVPVIDHPAVTPIAHEAFDLIFETLLEWRVSTPEDVEKDVL
jgi:hypothetical protein